MRTTKGIIIEYSLTFEDQIAFVCRVKRRQDIKMIVQT